MAEEKADLYVTLVQQYPQIHLYTDHKPNTKAGGNLNFPAGSFHATLQYVSDGTQDTWLYCEGLTNVTDSDGVVKDIPKAWIVARNSGVWQVQVKQVPGGDPPPVFPPSTDPVAAAILEVNKTLREIFHLS